MPNCTLCEESCSTISALKLHLKFRHQNHSGVFKCKERNCCRTLNNWQTFRRHLNTAHGNNFFCTNGIQKLAVSCVPMEYEEEGGIDGDLSHVADEIYDSDSFHLEDLENYMESLVMSLICKLYADPRLPRCYVQEFVEDIGDFLEDTLDKVKMILKPHCKSEESPTFDSVCTAITKPFREKFKTEHRRFSVIENLPNFVKAKDYVIGDKLADILRSGRVIQDRQSVKAKFVPMRETLRQFFSIPGVYRTTASYVKYLSSENGQGVLTNFIQANLWQSKLQHFVNKFVLPIFLYYDDFEVNNPLGSHSTVRKIGGVYFSIPCLPPEFRSKVENIFVAVLFRAGDRHTCFEGNDAIFSIIVEELNFLSREGIQIDVDGKTETVFFTLGLVVGDNEALNSSLGFMGGPGANFYCRICKMSKKECLKKSRVKESDMRSLAQYEADGFRNPEKTGVKENSIWNFVDGFHVTNNPYVDPAHDLLEGVCRYGMGQILYHLIFVDQHLTLEDLNFKIRSFNYRINGFSNKPPPLKLEKIKETKQIKMSASEMLTFVLIFPLLVEDILISDGERIEISFDSDVWVYFSLLRRILSLAFAKKVRLEHLDLLDSLVDRHNSMYICLFKDTLKPKFHNLRHMCHVILQSGPLSNLSVLRFESKHQQLKAISKSTTSRQNICHTISKKEQFRFFSRVQGRVGLKDSLEFCDGDVYHSLSLCENYSSYEKSFPFESFPGPFIFCRWVNRYGTCYSVGSHIVLDIDSDGMFVFGKIVQIIVNEQAEVCFVSEKLSIDSYSEEMLAYHVVYTSEMTCCLAENLLSPFLVVHHQISRGRHTITLRHNI